MLKLKPSFRACMFRSTGFYWSHPRGYAYSIIFFISKRYPRLNRESLLPIVKQVDPNLLTGSKKSEYFDQPPVDLSGWYPPGHGDVYRRFCDCGLAEKMRKAGKEWIFISNIDNLGACVDLSKYL